ncbi:gluconate 2-dehydrogenase subunit 3-like protein [Paraperlucidibaca baekdonensis]|uniref:Gluconate 2-dehydrogenase subunit 3-like protein n=1 Tax=Paraperlucidibaca baekdonensis TaxID=748120 RepID=A0A3E0H5W2_9GAMM|nr:gluconate 2-dehydrogenase subunit 3 family protein [Paraperlucidibaca baekdonensis]REH38932.1 gluconate 2-dehydrogenase subunit 3-like protein [Paraperlucidibaca baekdonensis]
MLIKTNTAQAHLPAALIERDLLQLSRRGFIRSGLWLGLGVAATTVAGVGYLRRSPRDALPTPEGLQVLSVNQYQLFQRLSEVCFPVADSALPVPVGIALQVDSLIAGVRADVRQQLLIGLDLFDNAALVRHGRRFIDLPADAARRYIDDWTNSSVSAFRAIANAATRLTKSAYWDNPAAWAAVNFPGPVTKPRGIERLGNAPSPPRAPMRSKAAVRPMITAARRGQRRLGASS